MLIFVSGLMVTGFLVMMSLTERVKKRFCELSMARRTSPSVIMPSTFSVLVVYHAKSETSFAYMSYRFAQKHVGRNHGQIVFLHNVTRFCKQAFAETTSGMKTRKVLRFEIACLHQRACKRIAHCKSRGC